MKIIWQPNPLKTIVELDEADKRALRLKLEVEELKEIISSAHFALDPNHREWVMKHASVKPTEEPAVEALRILDLSYVRGDTERGGKKFDAYLDERLDYCVKALTEAHEGDCTCFPCSCEKCWAESLVGIDTTPGLGKHPGNYIQSAFRLRAPDCHEPTIDEALEYLRDYKPIKGKGWEKYTDEQFQSHVPRWTADAKRAYEWLLNYKATKL